MAFEPRPTRARITSPLKAAFRNLGLHETMLAGRHREMYLMKLGDVATLWCRHDLDAVLLCAMGEHNKGLSPGDQEEIGRRILEFIQLEQRQFPGRATEPALRCHWNLNYFMVWDPSS